jgi:methylase of polypeptide subunit release factors
MQSSVSFVSFLDRQVERLLHEKYGGVPTEDFYRDEVRLRGGEPYEYVLGHVDFLGAKIDLSYRPMIPRTETAFWVGRAIEELRAKGHPVLCVLQIHFRGQET